MNMLPSKSKPSFLESVCAFFILMTGMSCAVAEPVVRPDERDAQRAARQEAKGAARETASRTGRAGLAGRDFDERRYVPAEGGKRNARLTPEERRDLRRQINEAGQDIYVNTPKK